MARGVSAAYIRIVGRVVLRPLETGLGAGKIGSIPSNRCHCRQFARKNRRP
jgi:hypothetical protein